MTGSVQLSFDADNGQGDVLASTHAFGIQTATRDDHVDWSKRQACCDSDLVDPVGLRHADRDFQPHLGRMLEMMEVGQRAVADRIGTSWAGHTGSVVFTASDPPR